MGQQGNEAEQISGASAPSAVTMPSNPSEKPQRAPMRSNAVVRRELPQDIADKDTAKTAMATHVGMTTHCVNRENFSSSKGFVLCALQKSDAVNQEQ